MIIVTRTVVAVVTIEAPTIEAADAAFDALRERVHWTLPKLRFGDVRVHRKQVSVHAVSDRGVIRGVEPQSQVKP